MIGLISPLVKIEHKTEGILLCCTMEDVQKKVNEQELTRCSSIFLYPFLKAGNGYWSKDINWGHYITNLLKLNWDYDGKLYIIMDGDHHAEMFESCRYLLNNSDTEEYAYCYNHAIGNIPDLIKEILSEKPVHYSSNLSIASILGSENFEISSDFWQLRIVKIINSVNIY